MRIFKSKWFAKFARKNRIEDGALKAAVAEIEAGNFDADLGGCVYKQRVARKGRGKSAGYRTIILFKQGERAFFVYGFAKNKRDSIGYNDLAWYKEAAKDYVFADEKQLDEWLEKGAFTEIIQEAK